MTPTKQQMDSAYRCLQHLNPHRKVLLLTGATQDERVQYLRGYLLPYLEECLFLPMVPMLEPTAEPMTALANSTFDFLTRGFSFKTPLEEEVAVDFSDLLVDGREDFVIKALHDHRFLVDIYRKIVEHIPHTLLIVAVISGTELSANVRYPFARFLAFFTEARIDAKVIVALDEDNDLMSTLRNCEFILLNEVACYDMNRSNLC